MTYQGDDARQGDVLRAQFDIHPADEAESEYYTPISDEGRRERIAFVARYADKIYSLNPDLLHVLPLGAEFLPYSHIDIDSVRPRPPNRRLDHVRILHAPTGWIPPKLGRTLSIDGVRTPTSMKSPPHSGQRLLVEPVRSYLQRPQQGPARSSRRP